MGEVQQESIHHEHPIRPAVVHTDFVEVLEGFSNESGTLCTTCELIDIPRRFRWFSPQSPSELSLNDALQRARDCSFCGILATAASRREALVKAAKRRRIDCTVFSKRLNQHESTEYPQLLLYVFVKLDPQDSDASLLSEGLHFGKSYNGGTYQNNFDYHPDDPLVILELVNEKPYLDDLPDEMPSSEYPSSDSSSDGSDFEIVYRKKVSAAWTSYRMRIPISPQIDISTVGRWLELSTELNCQKPFSKLYDNEPGSHVPIFSLMAQSRLRLINVVTGELETVRMLPRYVALSYVWGFDLAPNERTAWNDSEQKYTINWQAMPKTISDARVLVQKMGEIYLWVDSICIDQNDSGDKRAIIPEMDSIYGFAFLTIVAAAGDCASSGLPGVTTVRRRRDFEIPIRSHGKKITLMPKRPEHQCLVGCCKWSTRGWTYQERLVSLRCLFVTEVDASFLTGNSIRTERYRSVELHNTTPGLVTPGLCDNSEKATQDRARESRELTLADAILQPDALNWTHYINAVIAFSARNLTTPGDRLAAFQGLLNRFSAREIPANQQVALAGLPHRWFFRSLLWTLDQYDLMEKGQMQRIPFDNTQSRALPSWSWVGWAGPVAEMSQMRIPDDIPDVGISIMNESNVKCDSITINKPEYWPCDPQPREVAKNERVILHLWATKVELYVVPHEGYFYWLVYRDASAAQDIRVGHIWLDKTTAAECCDGQRHPCIVLHHKWLLTKKVGERYERRTLGWLGGKITYESIKQWGVLGHIMLQ